MYILLSSLENFQGQFCESINFCLLNIKESASFMYIFSVSTHKLISTVLIESEAFPIMRCRLFTLCSALFLTIPANASQTLLPCREPKKTQFHIFTQRGIVERAFRLILLTTTIAELHFLYFSAATTVDMLIQYSIYTSVLVLTDALGFEQHNADCK